MDESDELIESDENVLNYLYDNEPIAENLLPPISYVKRGDKRIRLISSASPGLLYIY